MKRLSLVCILLLIEPTLVTATERYHYVSPHVLRARIPFPDTSYEKLVTRIHSVSRGPCLWYNIDNATYFRESQLGSNDVLFDCHIRGPPPALKLHKGFGVKMFTGRRDESRMFFSSDSAEPLAMVNLKVRPLAGGDGCCIDFDCQLMDRRDIGSWLACTLLVDIQKDSTLVQQLNNASISYMQRALKLTRSLSG